MWSLQGYEFLAKEEAPDTVNPGAVAPRPGQHGQRTVQGRDRVYQVRGLDLSNMTIIEGDTGLIVIDPLVTAETAKAAMELYFKHRPQKAGARR